MYHELDVNCHIVMFLLISTSIFPKNVLVSSFTSKFSAGEAIVTATPSYIAVRLRWICVTSDLSSCSSIDGCLGLPLRHVVLPQVADGFTVPATSLSQPCWIEILWVSISLLQCWMWKVLHELQLIMIMLESAHQSMLNHPHDIGNITITSS